jgi:hypothetical protein
MPGAMTGSCFEYFKWSESRSWICPAGESEKEKR